MANHSGIAPSMMIGGDRDDEQQPIDGGVEDLAELADLVEAPGEVAVDPVRGAQRPEDQRCTDLIVEAEEHPEEHRQAQQPNEGEQVRHRPDPVEHRR